MIGKIVLIERWRKVRLLGRMCGDDDMNEGKILGRPGRIVLRGIVESKTENGYGLT